MAEPSVIALVSTFRRPKELKRLLDSLERSQPPLHRIYLTDNAGDTATATLATGSTIPCQFGTYTAVQGPGAAQADNVRRALLDNDWTHALLLDDDMVLEPDTLALLLHDLARSGAGVAAPLITNARGEVGWFPGVIDRDAWRVLLRPGLTLAAYRRECGVAPRRFRWAPWCALLVKRSTIEAAGLPSAVFGFEAEDIEYVLRLLQHDSAVLVPVAEARHWPPAARSDPEVSYLRGCLSLQNTSYVGLRTGHGRGLRRHLPGQAWRVLRRGRWRLRSWLDLARAVWLGVVLARPAGASGGGRFLSALRKREAQV